MPRKKDSSASVASRRKGESKPSLFVPSSAYAGTELRRHRPVDRSQQGAALSGAPNVPQKVVDSPAPSVIQFPSTDNQAAVPAANQQETHMTITLKGLSKNGKRAIFSGGKATFHVPVSAFPDGQPPATIEVVGEPFLAAATPKAKLTKEERAALPKPSLAEQAARARKRADALAAKLAAAGQPSL